MANLTIERPPVTEYPSSYAAYIDLVPDGDILAMLANQLGATLNLLRGVTEPVAMTRHAPYTWSVKEVVGHITDAERIFGARALRFARNDPTPLPAFDENDYVRAAHFDARPFEDIFEEYKLVRQGHLLMFRGVDPEAWHRMGVANANPVTVRALAFVIAGHERHHVNILRKRLSRT
jgi:hypothetical protein